MTNYFFEIIQSFSLIPPHRFHFWSTTKLKIAFLVELRLNIQIWLKTGGNILRADQPSSD